MKKLYLSAKIYPDQGSANNTRTIVIDFLRWNVAINIGVSVVNHAMFEADRVRDEENKKRWEAEKTGKYKAIEDLLRPYTTATQEELREFIMWNAQDEHEKYGRIP